MPTDPFVYSVKADKANPSSFMELCRTKDGYLFDELRIMRIGHTAIGVEMDFEYSRNGEWLTGLTPLTVPAVEFTESYQGCLTKNDWAKSSVVKRLFADGVRQYNRSKDKVKADLMADLAFITTLSS